MLRGLCGKLEDEPMQSGPIHVGRKVATTIIPDSRGSLAFIRKIIYKFQPNQFHTVLLYNRGTEPHTILFYHPDEVQVPHAGTSYIRNIGRIWLETVGYFR